MQTVLQRIQKATGHECHQPQPEKGLQPDLLPLCLQAQSSGFQRGWDAPQRTPKICRLVGLEPIRTRDVKREAAAEARGHSEHSAPPQAWLATSIAPIATRNDSWRAGGLPDWSSWRCPPQGGHKGCSTWAP